MSQSETARYGFESDSRSRGSDAARDAGLTDVTRPPVRRSRKFCIQKTVRAVQREAARGSPVTRRPLLVRSLSSAIFSSGSTIASTSFGPPATRNRFQRASPSHTDRYVSPLEAQQDLDGHRGPAAARDK